MKAMIYSRYGNAEELKLTDIDKPSPKDNEVLIKLFATSLNASDFELLQGSPAYTRFWGPFRPSIHILGSDIAGVVESIGKNVVLFSVGDEVLGDIFEKWGGLAEYVCAHEDAMLHKPETLSFQEAASIPQAAVVALQALRDKAQLKNGQKVLIKGAGGGAGTYAIQLAKLLGAEVTGVDNSEKQDLMKELGADFAIDYAKSDFTKGSKLYDIIIDFASYSSIFKYLKALKPSGQYILVGGKVSRLTQVLLWGPFLKIFTGKRFRILGHTQNKKDISYIINHIQSGDIRPVIDKQYTLDQTPEAFTYLMNGHAKGKIVISINNNSPQNTTRS